MRGETLLDELVEYARQGGGRGDDGGRGAEHGRDACRSGAAAAILRDLGVPSIRLITDFREDRLALESHRIQVTGCVPAHVSLSALGRRRGVRGEHDRHGRALDTDPTADVSGLAGNPR
jgi:GTP cyclohydrolase II